MTSTTTGDAQVAAGGPGELRPPAEVRYADELAALAAADARRGADVPPGWRLSPVRCARSSWATRSSA